jgi:hypothetical protein
MHGMKVGEILKRSKDTTQNSIERTAMSAAASAASSAMPAPGANKSIMRQAMNLPAMRFAKAVCVRESE